MSASEWAKAELAAMGAALGGLDFVQGPGGNCSVKADGSLWVKASGTRFAEVASPAGHAVVPLARALSALAGDADADAALFAMTPRPSLETYFHALGGRVVAHTHALGALLYACSSAPFQRNVAEGVVAIPYVRPGRGVAVAVQEALRATDRAECLCVLRSHGIVAYADSAARAIELTSRFDAQARAEAEKAGPLPAFAPFVAPYLAQPALGCQGGAYRTLPERVLAESSPPRYLFPDAAVCASYLLVDSLAEGRAAAEHALASFGRGAVLVTPSGARLAVARSEGQLRQTCEVLAAHDWLEDALRARGCAQYLADDEPAHILNMPAEQYRMQLGAHLK